MTKDEAIRLALTALENAPIEYDFHGNPMDAEFGKQLDAAVQALRQALEQPSDIEAAVRAENEACAKVIEAHQIPVGNSPAGEMACEWTYAALREVCEAIRARMK